MRKGIGKRMGKSKCKGRGRSRGRGRAKFSNMSGVRVVHQVYPPLPDFSSPKHFLPKILPTKKSRGGAMKLFYLTR